MPRKERNEDNPADVSRQGSRGLTLSKSESNPELCRDIMTQNPACCARSDTAHVVAQIMRDRDIGLVAVVDDEQNQKLVGIVTDRDLVLRLLADDNERSGVTAEEVMTEDIVACKPDDPIQNCLDAMESRQIRRIPIVEESGRIVGIIAQSDIAVRFGQPDKTAELIEELSRPTTMP